MSPFANVQIEEEPIAGLIFYPLEIEYDFILRSWTNFLISATVQHLLSNECGINSSKSYCQLYRSGKGLIFSRKEAI